MGPLRWVAVAVAVGAAAVAAGTSAVLSAHPAGSGTVLGFVWMAGVGLLIAALGTLIAWRVPQNPVGTLLAWAGAIVVFAAARPAYESAALRHPESLPLNLHTVVLFEEAGAWLLAAVGLILLYFPDGRLPGARWRWVAVGLIATAAAEHAYGVVQPEPLLPPLQHLARPYPPPPDAVQLAG